MPNLPKHIQIICLICRKLSLDKKNYQISKCFFFKCYKAIFLRNQQLSLICCWYFLRDDTYVLVVMRYKKLCMYTHGLHNTPQPYRQRQGSYTAGPRFRLYLLRGSLLVSNGPNLYLTRRVLERFRYRAFTGQLTIHHLKNVKFLFRC